MELLGEHLAKGTAHDREVLGEDEHLATIDGAPAGDHTVGVGPFVESGLVGPVAGEHVELVKRALVEQVVDALASEHLALVMLALDRPLRPCVHGGVLAGPQIVELGLHR